MMAIHMAKESIWRLVFSKAVDTQLGHVLGLLNVVDGETQDGGVVACHDVL